MEPVVDILGVKILNYDYNDLLERMNTSLNDGKKLFISYANANTINLSYNSPDFKDALNNKFIVHPDGVGIYIASAILNGRSKFKSRFTGSDFYPILAERLITNNNTVFFFGHTAETLQKIAYIYPGLNICGSEVGYDFDSVSLLNEINSLKPDFLIIGLGQPSQEQWVVKYHDLLEAGIIIAVGDGIKVFAGEKRRGPKFLRILGLEWMWRVLLNPLKYGKRYILGNPLFLYRIFVQKYVKLKP